MDSRLKTGLISIAALIGGYTFLSKGSKCSMKAETFMAAGGKSRPVAMRVNKIKDSNDLTYTPLINFFYSNPKMNKITAGFNRQDYQKYLKGDLKERFERNPIYNRRAQFGSFDEAVKVSMNRDYQKVLSAEYYNTIVATTKKYMLLCRIIVNQLKELQDKGVKTVADVSADVQFQKTLKLLYDYLKNIKIPFWSIFRPFTYTRMITYNDLPESFDVKSFMEVLGLTSEATVWNATAKRYWGEKEKDWDYGMLKELGCKVGIGPVQSNYAINLTLDKKQLEALEEFYFQNKEYFKYAQLVDYIQFFNKNPTIKYVAKIYNKGQRFYDKDIGNLDKFTRIKGLQDDYGHGALVKVWNNAEMKNIFTLDKLEKMQEQIFNLYKEARVVILRKTKSAGSRKEVLLERIEEFNKKSMSEFWNKYFNEPFDPTNPQKPPSLHEAVHQYLALTSNRNDMSRIWSPQNLKISATVKYVEQSRDGKYKITTKEGNISINAIRNSSGYLGLHSLITPEFIFNSVTLTKDFREMVMQDVYTFYTRKIQISKKELEKAKSNVGVLEISYKKLLDKYN